MKKNIINFLLFVLSFAFIAFFVFGDFNCEKRQANFQDLIISNDNWEEIIKSKKNKKMINELTFDGNALIYDSDDNNYYYSNKMEYEDSFNPLISWDSSNEIAIKETKVDNDFIKNNNRIELLAYNDDFYSISYLTITTLPIMNIDVYDGLIGDNDKQAEFTIYNNGSGSNNEIQDYKGEIRLRGLTTKEYPKKGFRIKLDTKAKEDNNIDEKKYNILNLPKDNTFVLYAGYNDKEKIRNVFSSKLWYESCSKDNCFNLELGYYYEYIELFINNKYHGLYAIGVQINKNKNIIDTKTTSKESLKENIYKVDFWGKHQVYNIEEKDISNYFELVTNKTSSESYESIKKYLSVLKDNNVDELYKSMDIDNAIDLFLYYNLIQATDNIKSEGDAYWFRNTFIIAKVVNESYVYLYMPWDLDRTWGHEFEDVDNLGVQEYSLDYSRNINVSTSPIYSLLEKNDEKIKSIIYDKYQQLRNGPWSDESVLNIISLYENDIYDSGAYIRDTNRWPEGSYNLKNEGLLDFKKYVIKRLYYFDEYVYNTYHQ